MLTVVGTPIGNLDDLSPRAAQALCAAAVIACEDTRRTAPLLHHIGARAPMVALHSHNEAGRIEGLLARLRAGEAVALVSDAGMPAVSDPGTRLVRAAAAAGIVVSVVPGPSAVTTAVAVAGLGDGHGFDFIGFLPRRPAERRAWSAALAGATRPVVAFESPHRLGESLAALAAELPEREVVVCRELTKRFEEIARGTAAELARTFADRVRGEVVVVIGPAPEGAADVGDEGPLREGLELMLAGGLGAGRAAEAAAALGVAPRNRAYALALELTAAKRAAT